MRMLRYAMCLCLLVIGAASVDAQTPFFWDVRDAPTPSPDSQSVFVFPEANRQLLSHKVEIPQEPHVSVYLDRVIYTDRDPRGDGLAVIDPPQTPGKLKMLQMRLSVEDAEGKTLAAHGPFKPGEDHTSFAFDVASLPAGSFTLHAEVLNSADEVVSRVARPFGKQASAAPAPPAGATVDLQSWSDARLGSGAYPITTAIPLPYGMISDTAHVRLLEDGQPVPSQTIVRSRWTRGGGPDAGDRAGSIRWLGLDFMARYNNGQPRRYQLEIGPSVDAAPAPAKPLTVEQSETAITVNTGPLEVVIGREAFRLFDRVSLDSNNDGQFSEQERVVQAEQTDGPRWIDAEGNAYYAANDREVKVEVVEAGPLKAIVRAQGWFVGEAGRECRFDTRMFFHSGEPFVRVNHTWIVTFDTKETRVSNIAVGVTVPGAERVMFPDGNEGDGSWGRAHPLKPDESVYLIQDRPDRWTIESPNHTERYGHRAQGWGTVTAGDAAVTLKMRRFWQLFPKEIEARGDQLLLHTWPAHGRQALDGELDVSNIYKLWWLHQGDVLDFNVPKNYVEKLEKLHEMQPAWDLGYVYAGAGADATGLALTNELYYGFHSAKDNRAAPVARTFMEVDPQFIADPAWTYQTGVMDGLWPEDSDYGQIEKGFANFLKQALHVIEHGEAYGQFNWPDGHTYYTPGSPRMIHRLWTGTHHNFTMAIWQHFIRSGKPLYWQHARERSRHSIDIDSINHIRGRRMAQNYPGAFHHCTGYTHWGGYNELMGHGVEIGHLLWNYLFTGDPRYLDRAGLWADSVLYASRGLEIHALNRNGVQPFGEVIEYYRMTRDPRMLRPMGDYAEGSLAPLRRGNSGRINNRPWYSRYYNQTRDPQMRDNVVEWVRAYTRPEQLGPTPPGIGPEGNAEAHAYAAIWSGDPSYVVKRWMRTSGFKDIRAYAYKSDLQLVQYPFPSQQQWGDDTRQLPTLLGVLAQHELPEVPSFYPASEVGIADAVLREPEDRAFTLRFVGWITAKSGLKLRVIAPDGATAAEAVVPEGEYLWRRPFLVKIPADGQSGEYRVTFDKPSGNPGQWLGPISDLPGEVYEVTAEHPLSGDARYFLRAPTETQAEIQAGTLTLNITQGAAQIETLQGRVLDRHGAGVYEFRGLDPGEFYRITLDSIYTLRPQAPATLWVAPSASHWFQPASEAK